MADATHLELLRPLGQGGFGTVWLATLRGRDGFSRRVAVKVMRDAPSQPAEIIARQRDEARLLGLLQHPNIVQVFDLTEVDGAPAVVMEHVEGVDVATLLKTYGALPESCVVSVGSAVAAALDAGWNATSPETGRTLRVIHRDIKPANVLVTVHGTVKVLDFGVARADFDREGRTQSMAFGTPRFMAPEQFLTGEVTPGNDVYALAVTMWEMLVGRSWERPPLSEEAFLSKVEAQLPAVPADFRPLMRGMMAWSTRSRPTAGEVAAALDDMKCQGDTLRTWARRSVPQALATQAAAGNRVASHPSTTPPVPATPATKPVATTPSVSKPTFGSAAVGAGNETISGSTPAFESAGPDSTPAFASVSSGSIAPVATPASRGPAAVRALSTPAADRSPTIDPDSSLASPTVPPGPTSSGQLAVGAAGALAGMGLVAGFSMLAAGLWWWNTQSPGNADTPEAEVAPPPTESAAVPTQDLGSTLIEPEANSAIAPAPTISPVVTTPSTGTNATGGRKLPASGKVGVAGPAPETPAAAPALPPEPETQVPTPIPAPTPAAEVVSPPVVVVSPEVPAAVVPVPTKTLNFKADSVGWMVYLDGQFIGKTPLLGTKVAYGNHQVRLVLNGNSAQKSFEVSTTTAGTLSYTSVKDMWTWQQ